MFDEQLAGFKGDEQCIRVVGHRGARGIMPENTLLGFEWTIKMGVAALEFDVMITKDSVPVIVHNHHLNRDITRTPQGDWLNAPEPRISDLTYEQLSQFDVGGLNIFTEYGQRFPEQIFMSGQKVPQLADLLRLINRPEFRHVRLMLEIKSDPHVPDHRDRQAQTVEAIVNVVRAHNVQARTVLHSFDWEMLRMCQIEAPEMPTSFLSQLPEEEATAGGDPASAFDAYVGTLPSVPQAVADAGGYIWAPYFKDVTEHDVAHAKQLGLLISPWTVNDPHDMVRMIDLGVDAIVTDYPARLQREMIKKQIRWQRTEENTNAALTSA
ncbi:glycerophosphodiester phosphodiesterase family protein [Maritalea myrionectae]|uniref:glycerophosphodiester phosphodiesterase family protein n=1 Tax=Maritalea myrionectae TaxID=454601 RepID=UPI000424AB49|nr:glycerophosphodiester phosphodiesterase family protein [Maritalea myrionectae]